MAPNSWPWPAPERIRILDYGLSQPTLHSVDPLLRKTQHCGQMRPGSPPSGWCKCTSQHLRVSICSFNPASEDSTWCQQLSSEQPVQQPELVSSQQIFTRLTCASELPGHICQILITICYNLRSWGNFTTRPSFSDRHPGPLNPVWCPTSLGHRHNSITTLGPNFRISHLAFQSWHTIHMLYFSNSLSALNNKKWETQK
jgi:hypothetical protein